MFEAKNDYYLITNKNMPLQNEIKRLKDITNKYELERLYYGLDNHNIFKRADRYKYKIWIGIIFLLLCASNLFEIIFNIIMLTAVRRKSEDFSFFDRLVTAFISLANILITLILSSITITKLKIQSYVFY